MTEEEVLAELREAGAITSGHFVLSSGRHSDLYIEKFRALERPRLATRLGEALASQFSASRVDVVAAPAVGGIILGFCVAAALGVRSIFCEREDGRMRFRRGFEIGPDESVLAVEDIITTGKSLNELLGIIPAEQLHGIGCLVDRSGGTLSWPRPMSALTRVDARSWEASACPMCAAGEDLTTPGSRHLSSRAGG